MIFIIMNTHVCKKCHHTKYLNSENFKPESRIKLGFESVCRECRKIERNNLRSQNIDIVRKKEAAYRLTDKYKNYQNQYWITNKEQLNDLAKERYASNPEPYLQRSKEQKKRLGDKYKEYLKEYRKKNRKRLAKYDLNRYHTDIQRKIRHLIGSGIRKRLNGQIKKSKSIDYIGCSWDELKHHLESNFSDGMTWENLGKIWHIDHIKPCAAFDFSDEIQIKQCFNFSNLQPLFVVDNLKKSDRLSDGTLARHKK